MTLGATLDKWKTCSNLKCLISNTIKSNSWLFKVLHCCCPPPQVYWALILSSPYVLPKSIFVYNKVCIWQYGWWIFSQSICFEILLLIHYEIFLEYIQFWEFAEKKKYNTYQEENPRHRTQYSHSVKIQKLIIYGY